MSKIITLEERAEAKKDFLNNLLNFVNSSNGRFTLLELDYLRDKKHVGDNTDRRVWGVIKDNISNAIFHLGMYGVRKTTDHYVTIRERENKELVDTINTINKWTRLNEGSSDTYFRIGKRNSSYDLNSFELATKRLKEMTLDIISNQ